MIVRLFGYSILTKHKISIHKFKYIKLLPLSLILITIKELH